MVQPQRQRLKSRTAPRARRTVADLIARLSRTARRTRLIDRLFHPLTAENKDLSWNMN